MANNTVLERLRAEFRSSGELKRLIIINTVVFIFLIGLRVISNLFKSEELYRIIANGMALPGNFGDLIFKPWSLITSLFTHYDLSHFFWNMLMLFFTGRLYLAFFSGSRLVVTYILGGMFGGLLQIAAYQIFPLFEDVPMGGIIGASGAIYAIIGAILYHRPKTTVQLFFAINIPFWVLAGLFLLSDFMALDQKSNVAHFAHIGGALFGVLSVMGMQNHNQLVNRLTRYWSNIKWTNPFKRQARFKVYKNDDVRRMTDDEYRGSKKENQDKVNAILEKISKGGYDSLTKSEKEFLFKFGNDL